MVACCSLLFLRKIGPEGPGSGKDNPAFAVSRSNNKSNDLKNHREWSALVTQAGKNFSLIAEDKSMDSRLLKSACLVLASACVAFTPMGCKKAPPVTLACNASAPAIFPGEPVNLTATPGALSTKKNVSVVYTWTGEGVTGNGTTATVNTASLAPGAYTVKVGVKEGKKGKEGLKPGEAADCSTGFTVKEFEPPTISCSSAPSTIKPGDDQHHYRGRHESAKPPADLQLCGCRRHHQRQPRPPRPTIRPERRQARRGSPATWPTTRARRRPATPA